MNKPIVFFDTEVGVSDEKVHDIGAVSEDGSTLHSSSISDFLSFINKALKASFYKASRVFQRSCGFCPRKISLAISHPYLLVWLLIPFVLFLFQPIHVMNAPL